jgi:hypothetical protein
MPGLRPPSAERAVNGPKTGTMRRSKFGTKSASPCGSILIQFASLHGNRFDYDLDASNTRRRRRRGPCRSIRTRTAWQSVGGRCPSMGVCLSTGNFFDFVDADWGGGVHGRAWAQPSIRDRRLGAVTMTKERKAAPPFTLARSASKAALRARARVVARPHA